MTERIQPETGRAAHGKLLKPAITLLPIVGVLWVSLYPLQPWMRQALILAVLIWFQAFYLLGILSLPNDMPGEARK